MGVLKPSRRGRAALTAALAAMVLAACLEPAGPEPRLSDQRAIYAMIEVGSTAARMIGRDLPSVGPTRPLVGATVTVGGPNGSTSLVSGARVTDCFRNSDEAALWGEGGCYSGRLSRVVEPGREYTLTVGLPDGRRIRGTVTTPSAPVVSIPADSQRVTTGYRQSPEGLPIVIVPLVLASAPGAGRVDAYTTVRAAWTSETRRTPGGRDTIVAIPIDPSTCTTRDEVLPFPVRNPPEPRDLWVYRLTCSPVSRWDSLDLDVHVVAAERNYADYMNTVLEGLATSGEQAGFGVDGAAGVFGALAKAVLKLRVLFVP
jgi:hypothetical protein